MNENTNEYSTKHPHEPEIPATYDDEGRCLICVLLVQVAQLEAENTELKQHNAYLERVIQAKIIGANHDALKEGG